MKHKRKVCMALVLAMLFSLVNVEIVFPEENNAEQVIQQNETLGDKAWETSDLEPAELPSSTDVSQEEQDETLGDKPSETPGLESAELPSSTDASQEENENNVNNEEDKRPVEIRVIDNLGQTISGAELCINSHYAVSDENGIAHFDGVEFGSYALKAVAYGYKEKATAIIIPKNSQQTYYFDMVLRPDDNEISAFMTIYPNDVEFSEKAQYYLDLFNGEDGFSEFSSPALPVSHESGEVIAECGGSIYYFASNGTYKCTANSLSWDGQVYDEMPNWRTYAGAVAVGSNIYIMGGIEDGAFSNLVSIFDTTSGTWSVGRNMPTVGAYFNAHYINGKIYAAGGVTQGDPRSSRPSDTGTGGYGYVLAEYSPETNSWINRASDDIYGISGATSAAYGNKIYFTGSLGWYAYSGTHIVKVYDVQSGQWEYAQNRPENNDDRGIFGGIFVNMSGCLYYQGGSSWMELDDEEYYYMTEDEPYIYIPETDEWLYILNEDNLKLRINDYQPVAVYDNTLYFPRKNYDSDNDTWTTNLSGIKIFNKGNDMEIVEQTDTYTVYRDRNGTLWREGLMTNDTGLSGTQSNTPLKIEYPFAIRQIDSYRNQTLAIDELGQVLAWGEGYYADGTDSMKTVTYPTAISGIDNPIQVSRGKNHNLVLDRNGDVWGFGSNSNNPMGNLGGKVKTVTKLNGIDNVQQIAAGTEFSIFLKNDGTVWAVGKNDKGQLGLGDTVNRTAPEQINGLSGVKKISVGEDYALALTSDGVYSWGANGHHQLGYSEANAIQNVPAKIEIALAEGEGIIDICAGMEFALALTSSGKVYSWGENTSGALGQSGIHYTPSLISSLSGIKKIEAGRRTGLAIDENNKLYSWGNGGNGQLGYSLSSVYTPREVTALSEKKISGITCGYSFSSAIDTDGNLYTFGDNTTGQLGVFSSEAIASERQEKVINDTLEEKLEIGESISYSVTVAAGQICMISFTAQTDGTYSFDTGTLPKGTTVTLYRDEGFTNPYKQTSSSGVITAGIEANSTVYLLFSNANNVAFNTNLAIEQTSVTVEDNKTYYMVLYDSYCGDEDSLWPRYYSTNENQKFEYKKEFFSNYLRLFKDKKIAFAISLRDLNFDSKPVGNDLVGEDETSLTYDQIISEGMPYETIVGCTKYYRRIINRMVEAYNELEAYERPTEFPEIYIGTPHFSAYAISDTDKWEYAREYQLAVENIYTRLTTENDGDLVSINPTLIKGLYFGRETPEIRNDSQYGYSENLSPERICLDYSSDFIHQKGKKILWIPFSCGSSANLDYIAEIANKGRYVSSSDNKTYDIFDLVFIQPGYYFREINSGTSDVDFTNTLDYIYKSVKNKKVVSPSNSVNLNKPTGTKISFQVEYDNSLITGRKTNDGTESNIDEKISYLSSTINQYNTFIYDTSTPVCIYSGGPNEQNYTYAPSDGKNLYRHSNRNHLTLVSDGHGKRYCDFDGAVDGINRGYNGDLIYDITNGIVNNIWSDDVKSYLKMSV